MKQCPQCKQTYLDDDLNFCLSDGTQLVFFWDSSDEETIIKPSSSIEKKTPTVQQGVNPLFAYLAVGLLGLLVGGAVITWMNSNSQVPSTIKNDSTATGAGVSNSKVNNTSLTPVNIQKTQPTSVTEDTSDFKIEVKNALDGWRQTLVSRDFDNHINYYSERLDTYYKRSNVDFSVVRKENLELFEKYFTFGLSISNLKIDVDSNNGKAITIFDSTYDFRREKVFHSGVSQTELRWKKINGAWKIISEKTLRIYRVNKR